MPNTCSFDAFLCHASTDAPWTRRLKNALAGNGLKVWLDSDEIRPGERFVPALEKGLAECETVVVVVSPEAMRSGWVTDEYSACLARTKRVIPCLLRGAELPLFLANRQCVDFRDESRFSDSLAELLFGIRGRHEEASGSSPRQLLPSLRIAPPHPVPTLIGRAKTMDLVRKAVVTRGCCGHFALHGMPGIGKTAIALAIAYDEAILRQFDSNVIWVGLGRKPDLLSHLATIGESLGISRDEMTALSSVQSRYRRVREVLGSRPVLVIMDDVWRLDDARSLWLGGETSTHLITTRHQDVALQFAEGRQNVEAVKELGKKESTDLLKQYVPVLVREFAGKIESLAEAVGRLPLALIIMGSYLRREGGLSGQKNRLGRALERLTDPASLLHALAGDGMPTSLWEAIGISYEELDAPARRMLRALAAFPPKPNTVSEAAACAVSTMNGETLYSLVDENLLEWAMVDAADPRQDRYTMHQAIENYAKAQPEIKEEQPDSYRRMVSYFVNLASYHREIHGGYRFLQADSGNVCTALALVHEAGMKHEFLAGARDLFGYLESFGLYHAAEDVLKKAHAIALESGDQEALAASLNGRSRMARKQGKYAEAEAWARSGLAIAGQAGDEVAACRLLGNLGGVMANLGKYREAAGCLDRALADACRLGEDDQVSTLLRARGAVAANLGEFSQAEEFYRRGLMVAEARGQGWQYGRLCAFFGELKTLRGEYAQAEDYLHMGLQKAEAIAYSEVECISLQNLGLLEMKRGNDQSAERLLRRSLQIARSMNHKERVSYVLGDLALLKIETQMSNSSCKYLDEAGRIAKEIGHPKRMAYLMVLSGRVAHAESRYEDAERVLASALELGRSTEVWWNVSCALLALGEVHLSQGNLDAAGASFDLLLRRSREAKTPEFTANALFGKARIHAAQGERESASNLGAESLEIHRGIGHRAARHVEMWLQEHA
jgi:tetratricopeptide (TPR) repeat protein